MGRPSQGTDLCLDTLDALPTRLHGFRSDGHCNVKHTRNSNWGLQRVEGTGLCALHAAAPHPPCNACFGALDDTSQQPSLICTRHGTARLPKVLLTSSPHEKKIPFVTQWLNSNLLVKVLTPHAGLSQSQGFSITATGLLEHLAPGTQLNWCQRHSVKRCHIVRHFQTHAGSALRCICRYRYSSEAGPTCLGAAL